MTTRNLSNAQRLREFHRAVGVAWLPERPSVPPLEVLNLRRTLIDEEVAEVHEEFDALSTRLSAAEPLEATALTALAHELTDLLYVTYGALDMLGLDADAVFAEVHRANLSKTSGPKRADGKQLKPAGWQPADVQAVIERLSRKTL